MTWASTCSSGRAPTGGGRSTSSTSAARSAAAECMHRRVGAGPRATRRRCVPSRAEVPLDPGFGPLVDELRAAGAEVTVVSDGFGFYVEEACAPLGARGAHERGRLRDRASWSFPHEDRCCPCSTCGVCKQAPIKDAKLPRADHRAGRRRRERPQGGAARRRRVRQGLARRLVRRVRRRRACRSRPSTMCATALDRGLTPTGVS